MKPPLIDSIIDSSINDFLFLTNSYPLPPRTQSNIPVGWCLISRCSLPASPLPASVTPGVVTWKSYPHNAKDKFYTPAGARQSSLASPLAQVLSFPPAWSDAKTTNLLHLHVCFSSCALAIFTGCGQSPLSLWMDVRNSLDIYTLQRTFFNIYMNPRLYPPK